MRGGVKTRLVLFGGEMLVVGVTCEVVAFVGMIILLKTAPDVWCENSRK